MNRWSFTVRGTTWELAEPLALLLLILCLLPWLREIGRPRLAWPTLRGFPRRFTVRSTLLRHLPPLVAALGIACAVVALARPRTIGDITRVAGKGVTIVVALDRSASMTTEDFPARSGGKKVSRLDAARATFAQFVARRSEDLLGLIAFARTPQRVAPPTLDRGFLLDAARSLRAAGSDEGGTNLGYAIAYGLGELRPSPTRKKVLILLTDGRDAPASLVGAAPVVPEDAARLARALGVTLHTIAVGSPPDAVAPLDPTTQLPLPTPRTGPDFDRLRTLADLGGGEAFSAANTADLDRAFATINALEKSPVAGPVRIRYREGYAPWLLAAAVLLGLERLLALGPLRRLP